MAGTSLPSQKEKSVLPNEVAHWSLTALRERLAKIGVKVVGHGRYAMSQLTDVAVSRDLFRKILSLIDDLRPRSASVLAGGIDGQVKTAGGVCLNGGKSGQMAFRTRANPQNQAIGWLRKGFSSLGGGTVVLFP